MFMYSRAPHIVVKRERLLGQHVHEERDEIVASLITIESAEFYELQHQVSAHLDRLGDCT